MDFENGSYGSRVANWKVFERTGDAGLAAEKADKLLNRFQRYLAAQANKRRKARSGGGGGGGRRC